jgi:hypothetical protein
VAFFIVLASGYSLHHLRALTRTRGALVRSVVPLLSLSLLLPSAANEELRMKNEKYLLADEKRISLYMLNKKQLYL